MGWRCAGLINWRLLGYRYDRLELLGLAPGVGSWRVLSVV